MELKGISFRANKYFQLKGDQNCSGSSLEAAVKAFFGELDPGKGERARKMGIIRLCSISSGLTRVLGSDGYADCAELSSGSVVGAA